MSVCRVVAALAIAANIGCAAATARSGSSAPIQTDRPAYTVNDSGGVAHLTIHMTYTNGTGKDVYLPTCRGPQPPRLQKQVGETWVVAFAPNILACESAPVVVRSGASYDYTFQILAGMPGSTYAPRFTVDIPGTYRLLWEIFRSESGNGSHSVTTHDPVPVEQEISNTFQLVRAR